MSLIMIKKTLGIMLATIIFAGMPSVVMAGCSADNSSITYSEGNCAGAGGTWTRAPTVNNAAPLGGGGGGAPAGSPSPLGGGGVGAPVTITNPILFGTFSAFVAEVIRVAVEILTPFVVLAFVWSGFMFVRAQGNEKELEEAKSAIKWSVIGAFILMGAWGFAQIIGATIRTITAP